MKLLFDQNLSRKLVDRVSDLFPGSTHVQSEGLEQASDVDVWNHARSRGLTIVTKDDDFDSLSVVHGHPPKVIWLQTGNCTTTQVETLLRDRIADFGLRERSVSRDADSQLAPTADS